MAEAFTLLEDASVAALNTLRVPARARWLAELHSAEACRACSTRRRRGAVSWRSARAATCCSPRTSQASCCARGSRPWAWCRTTARRRPCAPLIDWIGVLLRSGMSAADIEQHIPFLGALLKNEQDTEALDRHQKRGGNYPSEWRQLGPRYNN